MPFINQSINYAAVVSLKFRFGSRLLKTFTFLLLFLGLHSQAQAASRVKGHVDGVKVFGGKHYVSGWACQTGHNDSNKRGRSQIKCFLTKALSFGGVFCVYDV